MEHKAWCRGAIAVEDIAQDRVSQSASIPRGRGVYSQLVTPTGDGFKLNASPIDFPGHDAEVSLGRATKFVIDNLVGAIGEICPHRERDVTLIDINQAANKGDIAFLSFAKFKLHAEVALSFRVQSHDQEARSVHIKAVDNQRPRGGRKHSSNA